MISNAFRYNAGLIRANGTPFFTGDGSTSSAQLVDRHGNPISSDKLKRVDAIHRTDWQGRQLLYMTPRTNQCPHSEDLSAWSRNNTVNSAASASIGPCTYWECTKVTATTSASTSINAGAANTVTPEILTAALRAGTSSVMSVGLYGLGGSGWGTTPCVMQVLSGPGSVFFTSGALNTISGLSTSEDTIIQLSRQYATPENVGVYFYPAGVSSTVTGASGLITRVMVSTSPGAYITTSSAARTVTDYTLSGSTVAFGEPPAGESSPGANDAAVCDWTGVARR